MDKTKVSVIVPIYNSENYLVKCLESVIQQTHHHLEIILINDGSTDSSSKIIDEYTSKDDRIVPIHKKNGGIGSAYKAAFEVMTGEYVLLVDSDDWLELNAVEELVKLALDNNADMVHFGLLVANEKNEIIERVKTHEGVVIGANNILDIHFKHLKHPSLCRLFRRSLFNNIEVLEQNIGIDEMLIVQLLTKCNKALYIRTNYYTALARNQSVSRVTYSLKKIQEGIKVYRFIVNFVETNNDKYAQYLYVKQLYYLQKIYNIMHISNELKKSEEYVTVVKDFYSTYNKAKSTSAFKQQSLPSKIKLHLFVMIRPLYHAFTFFRNK